MYLHHTCSNTNIFRRANRKLCKYICLLNRNRNGFLYNDLNFRSRQSTPCSYLVPLERLELPTFAFEARCSRSTELQRQNLAEKGEYDSHAYYYARSAFQAVPEPLWFSSPILLIYTDSIRM